MGVKEEIRYKYRTINEIVEPINALDFITWKFLFLVERCAEILNNRNFVPAQVQLPIPHRVDVLAGSLDQVGRALYHSSAREIPTC